MRRGIVGTLFPAVIVFRLCRLLYSPSQSERMAQPKNNALRNYSFLSRDETTQRKSRAKVAKILPNTDNSMQKPDRLKKLFIFHSLFFLQWKSESKCTLHRETRETRLEITRVFILQNFVVRQSSQSDTMALSVRLPPGKGPYIEHYLIQSNKGKLSLETSENRFDNIPSLIAHYSQCWWVIYSFNWIN